MKKLLIAAIVPTIIFLGIYLFKDKEAPKEDETPVESVHSPEGDTEYDDGSAGFDLPTDYSDLDPSERYAAKFDQARASLQNDPYNPDEVPPEVEILKNLELPEQEAMAHVHELLGIYAYNGNDGVLNGFTNVEMVNELLGDNPSQLAFIPAKHPRIDEHGQLTDRWGGAYDFHVISSMNVGITSPGPDKKLHTEDDVVLNLDGEYADEIRLEQQGDSVIAEEAEEEEQ